MSYKKNIHDEFIKTLHGLGDTVFEHWMPRMVVQGVDMNDVFRIRSKNPTWEEWPHLWEDLGELHEKRGDEALKKGYIITAGQEFRQAELAYHFGHFMLFDRPEYKKILMGKSKAALEKGLPYQRFPGKRVYIDCEEWKIPTLLFELPDSEGRLLILTGGADANKEEMISFADVFLERGISVLIMDGPGQGEAAYIAPYRRSTHKKFYDTAVNYVHFLGYDKLATGGISFGGHLNPRAAAINHNFRCAFGVGGMYDMRDLETRMDKLFIGDFGHVLGTEDYDELIRLAKEEITLDDVIENLTCPLMIIHGDQDRICDVTNASMIIEKSNSIEKNLIVLPGANHVCNNYVYLYRPVIADWVREKLQ